MRRLGLLVAVATALVACTSEPSPTPRTACPTQPPTATSAQASLTDAELATVTVSGAVEGEFVIELLGDDAPLATANFVDLARCGFYDGVTFHRVLAGFVIQAGDPQTRDNRADFPGLGTGGPGYDFEIEPPPDGLRYDPYAVAMANDGSTNGSQFFIDLVDLDDALRRVGVFTIFGQVVSGTEVIDEIATVPVNDPRVGVPLDAVVIDSIVISSQADPSPS
jgi:cyclophilin family peptidyl-prolyl cis-trans isomerase